MKDALANPAPLGLMGFGMTTVLLNIHNAGFFENDIMILAMGIFYGGLAQVIAGIMEFKKGNTFGTTAFTSFGLFTGLEGIPLHFDQKTCLIITTVTMINGARSNTQPTRATKRPGVF